MIRGFVFLVTFSLLQVASGKIKVVTSTTDILSVVKIVGGDYIEATSIARGTQDPHYLEAKPSYMVSLRDADLLISNGLSLEIGWLPSLIRGARNPKINPDQVGYLELGRLTTPIKKTSGPITRALGDVHPEGNPHFTLDPIRVGELAVLIAKKLGDLDPTNKSKYEEHAKAYQDLLKRRFEDWKSRIAKTNIKKVISYHSSLDYFLERFQIESVIYLEAKPGIPPSTQHILKVIETAKKEQIKLILIDNYFDTKIGERVKKDVPSINVVSIGIAVGSEPGLNSIEDVLEKLVKTIEGK